MIACDLPRLKGPYLGVAFLVVASASLLIFLYKFVSFLVFELPNFLPNPLQGQQSEPNYSTYRKMLSSSSNFVAANAIHFNNTSKLVPTKFKLKSTEKLSLLSCTTNMVQSPKLSFMDALRHHPSVRIFSQVLWENLPDALGTPAGPSIALIRILGNDLPPRHTHDQTLRNLQFTLENEAKFIDVCRIWIINRIVDSKKREQLEGLLRLYKQPFAVIPVRLAEEYGNQGRRSPGSAQRASNAAPTCSLAHSVDGFKGVDLLHDPRFFRMSSKMKSFTVDRIYHQKNLYIMNNNGGRNAALRLGKALGFEWIMVFDGNCYVTGEAMQAIQRDLATYGYRGTCPSETLRNFPGLRECDSYYENPYTRIRKTCLNCTDRSHVPMLAASSSSNSTSGTSSQLWLQISSGNFRLRNVQYFVVPMARILNNTQLVLFDAAHSHSAAVGNSTIISANNGTKIKGSRSYWSPNANEEPQVIFRADSLEEFHEGMRYGRRPKVELLWRIGVPKTSFFLKSLPWEERSTHASASSVKSVDSTMATAASSIHNVKMYRPTGWTARLFSGNPSQESSDEASKKRNTNRIAGIHEFIDMVDADLLAQVGGQSWQGPSFYKVDEMGSSMKREILANAEIKLEKDEAITHTSMCPRLRLLNHGWPTFAGNKPTAESLVEIERLVNDLLLFSLAVSIDRSSKFLVQCLQLLESLASIAEIESFDECLSSCSMLDACLSLFNLDRPSFLINKKEDLGFKNDEDELIMEEDGKCQWDRRTGSKKCFDKSEHVIQTSSSFVGMLPHQSEWLLLSDDPPLSGSQEANNSDYDNVHLKLQESIGWLIQVVNICLLTESLSLLKLLLADKETAVYYGGEDKQDLVSQIAMHIENWNTRLTLVDFWLTATPYPVGSVPLSVTSTTSSLFPLLLYDISSPLLSYPQYVTNVNRPDRNCYYDLLCLVLSKYLDDKKKFVKGVSSLESRLLAQLPKPQPNYRNSTFAPKAETPFITSTFQKIDPLYVNSPAFRMRGPGIPSFPLRVSKSKFHIPWIFNDSVISLAGVLQEEFAMQQEQKGRGLQNVLASPQGTTDVGRLRHLLVESSLFVFENGFIGTHDPMDSSSRNIQALLASNPVVLQPKSSSVSKLQVERANAAVGLEKLLFSPMVPASSINSTADSGRPQAAQRTRKIFACKYHPWLHFMPVLNAHPLFPQLLSNEESPQATTTTTTTRAHRSSRIGTKSLSSQSSMSFSMPSPHDIRTLQVSYWIMSCLLLRNMGLSLPSGIRNLFAFYLGTANFLIDDDEKMTKPRPYCFGKEEEEEEAQLEAVLTFGLVRPCYYPNSLIIPGSLKDSKEIPLFSNETTNAFLPYL